MLIVKLQHYSRVMAVASKTRINPGCSSGRSIQSPLSRKQRNPQSYLPHWERLLTALLTNPRCYSRYPIRTARRSQHWLSLAGTTEQTPHLQLSEIEREAGPGIISRFVRYLGSYRFLPMCNRACGGQRGSRCDKTAFRHSSPQRSKLAPAARTGSIGQNLQPFSISNRAPD